MFAISQALSPNGYEKRRHDTRESEQGKNRKGDKLKSHNKRYASFAKNQPVGEKNSVYHSASDFR